LAQGGLLARGVGFDLCGNFLKGEKWRATINIVFVIPAKSGFIGWV
jgi:hypothetical protein